MALTELSYPLLFRGANTRFPDDWSRHAIHGTLNCKECGLRAQTAEKAIFHC